MIPTEENLMFLKFLSKTIASTKIAICFFKEFILSGKNTEIYNEFGEILGCNKNLFWETFIKKDLY